MEIPNGERMPSPIQRRAVRGLSTLVDNVVLDERGEQVGHIEELIIDCRSGRITHVIVKSPNRTRKRRAWRDLRVSGRGIVLKDSVSSRSAR